MPLVYPLSKFLSNFAGKKFYKKIIIGYSDIPGPKWPGNMPCNRDTVDRHKQHGRGLDCPRPNVEECRILSIFVRVNQSLLIILQT